MGPNKLFKTDFGYFFRVRSQRTENDVFAILKLINAKNSSK